MKIQSLLTKSHRSYDRNYPGCLLQYSHDIEMVYEELKELNIDVTDGIKHYNLLGNLESVVEPCFQGIQLPDTFKDTSYDHFLSSMVHMKLHKPQLTM